MVAQVFGKGRSVIRGAGRAALVPAAAVAVHQLRYLLAFGGNAGAELAREGHSYLHSLVPWIMALIGVAAGGFLWSLGRAFARPDLGPSLHALAHGPVGGLRRVPAGDLRHPGVPRRAVRRRPPGRSRAGSSATAAGGRSRRRRASGSCWRPCSTARGGWCGRSRCVGPGRGPPVRRAGGAAAPVRRSRSSPLSPLADGWSGRGPPGSRSAPRASRGPCPTYDAVEWNIENP